jgi:hypothetical protein
MSPITQAERSGWQRHAARELAAILDTHRDLPVIAWTLGPAGSTVTGRVNGLAPAAEVRQVFAAWRAALMLAGHRELTSGGTTRLRAAARRDRVQVRLTANVFNDEDEDR